MSKSPRSSNEISKIGLHIGQRHNGVHFGQKCITILRVPAERFPVIMDLDSKICCRTS